MTAVTAPIISLFIHYKILKMHQPVSFYIIPLLVFQGQLCYIDKMHTVISLILKIQSNQVNKQHSSNDTTILILFFFSWRIDLPHDHSNDLSSLGPTRRSDPKPSFSSVAQQLIIHLEIKTLIVLHRSSITCIKVIDPDLQGIMGTAT